MTGDNPKITYARLHNSSLHKIKTNTVNHIHCNILNLKTESTFLLVLFISATKILEEFLRKGQSNHVKRNLFIKKIT